MNRCAWAKTELSISYHDREWGVPVHDDRVLFEFLNLEGAQAGLSWETILQKRESYRAAFDQWDAQKIARYDARKIAALLANPGIVKQLNGAGYFPPPADQPVDFGPFMKAEIAKLAKIVQQTGVAEN